MTCMTTSNDCTYSYNYDKLHDILRVTIKYSDDFYYDDTLDCIWFRKDDDTDELVGFQIIDFSKIDINELGVFFDRDVIKFLEGILK